MASRSLQAGAAGGAGRAAARLERAHQLAARLVHDGERSARRRPRRRAMPRARRSRAGGPPRARRLRDSRRTRSGGRASRCSEPLRRPDRASGALSRDLGQALVDVGAGAARVVVAGARPFGRDLAGLVEHDVFAWRGRAVSRSAARGVEAASMPRRAERARERRGLVLGECERAAPAMRTASLSALVASARRAARLPVIPPPPRGLRPISKCLATVAASSPILASQSAGRAREARFLCTSPSGGVRHVAHQRVLEGPLARARESATRLARSADSAPASSEQRRSARGPPAPRARRPTREARTPRARHRVAARLLERVEAHLDGRLDGGRGVRVLAERGETRQLLGEERRARGLRRDADRAPARRRVSPSIALAIRARRSPRDGAQLDPHVIAPDERAGLVAPENSGRTRASTQSGRPAARPSR